MRIATASVRTGFAMTGFAWSAVCGGTHGSRPTEWFVEADDPVRPVPTTQHFVGQGPCALPECNSYRRRGEGTPPYGGQEVRYGGPM